MRKSEGSTRRQFLGIAGTAAAIGTIPVVSLRPVAATPETMTAAIRNVIGSAVVRTGKVKLDVPPLVENGNTVPMTVTVSSPNTPEDHCNRAPVRRFAVVRHGRRRGDTGRLHRGGDLMTSALINVPKKAKRGDVIEIKTLMSHIMETGYRHTAAGQVIPRDIITSFTCRYNGEEIFRADLFPAIAANPFISFFTVATESGKFDFEWIGDNGFSETASATISVE